MKVEENETCSGYQWNTKWYNHYRFPLIPVVETRKADKYNTKNISFTWMFLKFWVLDCFEFEIAFTLTSHWGIGIAMILPYLRIVFAIPFPESWLMRWNKLTSRSSNLNYD
jgi:hypothetical protein